MPYLESDTPSLLEKKSIDICIYHILTIYSATLDNIYPSFSLIHGTGKSRPQWACQAWTPPYYLRSTLQSHCFDCRAINFVNNLKRLEYDYLKRNPRFQLPPLHFLSLHSFGFERDISVSESCGMRSILS